MSTLTQSFALPPGTLPQGPFDLPTAGDQPGQEDPHQRSRSSSTASSVAGPHSEEAEGPVCEVCACEIPLVFSPAPNDGEVNVELRKQASSMIVESFATEQHPSSQHILPIVCSEGHHVCVSCFSQYMAMTWVNNTRPHLDTLSPENLPEVRCVVAGCNSHSFPRNVVLRHTSTDASDAFLKLLQDIQDIATLSKAQSLMVGASSASTSRREEEELAARALLRAQLQSQGRMLMCPTCGFGPVEQNGCNDLTNISARNSCPSCGFYSANAGEWRAWDGEIRSGVVGAGRVHHIVSRLLYIWIPICLVLTIAAASTNWFIVQPSEQSMRDDGHECIKFSLFNVNIGCSGATPIGVLSAHHDLGLCAAHLSHLKTGAAFSILSILVMVTTIILTIVHNCCSSARMPPIVLPIFWSIIWFFSLLSWAPPVAFFHRSFCKSQSISGGLLGDGARGDVGLLLGVLSWVITTVLLLILFTVKVFVTRSR